MKHFALLDLQIDARCLDGVPLPVHRTLGRMQKYAKEQAKDHDLLPTDVLLISSRRTKDYILDQLPSSILRIEVPELSILEMSVPLGSISPMFGAHVDLARKASLNYYMEVNGETTHFYNWDDGHVTEVESFDAEDGDCYLLDVSVPHGVSLVPGTRRRVLTMSFVRTDFDTLRRACASHIRERD